MVELEPFFSFFFLQSLDIRCGLGLWAAGEGWHGRGGGESDNYDDDDDKRRLLTP